MEIVIMSERENVSKKGNKNLKAKTEKKKYPINCLMAILWLHNHKKKTDVRARND